MPLILTDLNRTVLISAGNAEIAALGEAASVLSIAGENLALIRVKLPSYAGILDALYRISEILDEQCEEVLRVAREGATDRRDAAIESDQAF